MALNRKYESFEKTFLRILSTAANLFFYAEMSLVKEANGKKKQFLILLACVNQEFNYFHGKSSIFIHFLFKWQSSL